LINVLASTITYIISPVNYFGRTDHPQALNTLI
jgi:hypothetical protein